MRKDRIGVAGKVVWYSPSEKLPERAGEYVWDGRTRRVWDGSHWMRVMWDGKLIDAEAPVWWCYMPDVPTQEG